MMPVIRLLLSAYILLAHVPCAFAQGEAKLPPELHQNTVFGVTAHFGGERGQNDAEAPLEFLVSHLWFTFSGDERTYLFRPRGELFFSDWQFDIFSPDGARVLLLQDHFGPYHVVELGNLKPYLMGSVEPDFVVSAHTPDSPVSSGTATVYHDARWTSPDTIGFKFTCCGQTWTKEAFVDTNQIPGVPAERAK